MPNRTAKFVSAIFAVILAGTPLTTISHSEPVAADDCLSGPKGQTPPGSHWYYRIEHGTKRHCWYLREERDGLSQAAPQNVSPLAKPLPPQADTEMQISVANARAELPAQTNRNDGPNPALPSNAAVLNDTPRANAGDANAASTVVASRWPEPSAVSSASDPRPATTRLAANVPANSTGAPVPALAIAAVALTAADSSSQSQPGPISTLFVAVISALALAGITASLILKFGRARHPRRETIRARRGPIWQSTDDDRIVLSDLPNTDVLPHRTRFSRGIGEARDPDDRMAEFLSRISGRSPT